MRKSPSRSIALHLPDRLMGLGVSPPTTSVIEDVWHIARATVDCSTDSWRSFDFLPWPSLVSPFGLCGPLVPTCQPIELRATELPSKEHLDRDDRALFRHRPALICHVRLRSRHPAESAYGILLLQRPDVSAICHSRNEWIPRRIKPDDQKRMHHGAVSMTKTHQCLTKDA